mmetsp:Transcript_18865/g.57004  ORF Transcript_18865/g.57004 Transcript_18865/m.57004 type:complete len:202 (-) Transcript_18865:847-1452(-)
MALDRLLPPHDEAQQCTLARAIGANQGDTLAPFDLQAGLIEQPMVSVPVGEVLDADRLLAHPLHGGEEEHLLLGLEGFAHLSLAVVELLYCLLGGGGSAGVATGRQPLHDFLLASNFLLLLLVGGPLLRHSGLLGLHELGIVAGVRVGVAPLRVHDLGAQLVQELPIVTDNHHWHVLLLQVPLKPFNGVEIQVVGGLIQHQ